MFKRAIFLNVVVAVSAIVMLLVLLPAMPAQAEFGTNWTAQFYNCTDFTCASAATVVYPSGINASWGTGSPTDANGAVIPGVNPDNFAVRFSSTQSFVADNYDFQITSQDGFRLYIDGALVQDEFVTRSLTTSTVTVSLTAGSHSIIVEYFNSTGSATIQVQWFQAGAVPTGAPTGTPQPIAQASVVSVRGLAVRTGPYLGASLITVARPGNIYDVSARNTSEGIYTWYLITVGDQIGWSSGRYLQIEGDINNIPLIGTIFDQIDAAPDIGVRGVTRAIMNFRVRPSIRTARLFQIPWGDEVVILGRTIQGGKDFWYHVSYNGVVGWIFAPYVSVSGPIDALPVR